MFGHLTRGAGSVHTLHCIVFLGSLALPTAARNNNIQNSNMKRHAGIVVSSVLCIVIACAPDQNHFQYVLHTDNKVVAEF